MTDLCALKPLAKSISPGPTGRPVSPSTLSRWITTGAMLSDGSILKLKAVRYPGGWQCSERWLREFLDRLTRDRARTATSPLVDEGSKFGSQHIAC
jgi:hypothetical protein